MGRVRGRRRTFAATVFLSATLCAFFVITTHSVGQGFSEREAEATTSALSADPQASLSAPVTALDSGVQATQVPMELVGMVSLAELMPDHPEEVADALVAADRRARRVNDLNARLEQVFAEETGKGARLALYVLDPISGTIVASINPEEEFVAASTYKLFVAYSMILEVEAGKTDWDKRLLGRQTVGDCLEIMITESNNSCAEAWLNRVNPKVIQGQISELGLANTRIAWSNMRTTARDLAVFLDTLLEDGIVRRVHRDLLLGHMREQLFRDGVPKGVGWETPVANKVGFLDGYLHDAAIVEDPENPLVLVVLTSGASWNTIADLSQVVFRSFAGTEDFPGLLE